MLRRRLSTVLTLATILLLTAAPAALAGGNGSGQGWYGETNDKTITEAMFLVIIFFPLIIALFSFIQSRLDRRKHAREDAIRRHATSAEWQGGW